MSNTASTLDRLVSQAGELYSLPAVAVEILELTNDPRVGARQLKECIENDPAMTTKILRVVNSSLFGLSQQVSDLNQALAFLGIKPLKLLVLGFSLPDGLFGEIAGEVLEHYWQHALVKAVAAREISESLWRMPGDEAFIAGLLQDLGELVLVQRLGEPYIRFVRKIAAGDGDLKQLEREILGFDHTQLTARLLSHWHLPETVVQAVWLEDPHSSEVHPTARVLSRILGQAELVAKLFSERQTHRLSELLSDTTDGPRLSASTLSSLVGELQQRVEHLADVLSLELPTGLDYRDLLDQAHRQLVEVAADVATDLVGQNLPASPARSASRPRDLSEAENESRSLTAAVELLLTQPTAEVAPQEHPVGKPVSLARPTATHGSHAAPSAAAATTAWRTSATTAASAISKPDDDATLNGLLREAVGACRQMRCALSLLLIEVEDYEQVVFAQGLEAARQLLDLLSWECHRIDHVGAWTIQLRESRFAVVLPNCDRRQVLEQGKQLLRQVRHFKGAGLDDAKPPLNISIGAASVALPPKNFPVQELVQSADRCLYGAQAAGGNTIKSIEIY